jgi:hypothetical protein
LPTRSENGEVWPELRWIKPKDDKAIEPFSHLNAVFTPPVQLTKAPSDIIPPKEDDRIPEAREYEAKAEQELQKAVQIGASRWTCPVFHCEASYQFKNDLKQHLRRKHSERHDLARIVAPDKSTKIGKKFPCPHHACASGFNWRRDLRRHLMQRHGPPVNSVVLRKPRRKDGSVEKSEEPRINPTIETPPVHSPNVNQGYEAMLLDGSYQHLPESFV